MTSHDAKAAPTGGVSPGGRPRIPGRRRTASAAALWMLALSPVMWLMCAGLFVLRARVALGRWPRPYEPDPKDVGYLHYMAVQSGIPLMWALSLTCVVVAVVWFRQLVNEGRDIWERLRCWRCASQPFSDLLNSIRVTCLPGWAIEEFARR